MATDGMPHNCLHFIRYNISENIFSMSCNYGPNMVSRGIQQHTYLESAHEYRNITNVMLHLKYSSQLNERAASGPIIGP